MKDELRAEINRLFDSSSCQREIVYALQKFGRKSSAAELKNALLLLRSAEREQDEALIIGSTAEWENFCERVAEGEDFSGQIVTLSADLDFGGETISPVGDDGNCFAGVFDGNGHIIKNAVIDSGDSEYSGLFSILTEGACVTGVTLKDCKVFGMSSGGICARAVRCEIKRSQILAAGSQKAASPSVYCRPLIKRQPFQQAFSRAVRTPSPRKERSQSTPTELSMWARSSSGSSFSERYTAALWRSSLRR